MSVERLRFKDENGENYIDKYEVQIGDVSKIYQPKTISSNELTTDGFTVYGANGIIGNYHSYNHSSDQVLISCRGENCGTVNFSNGKCWITGNTMVINVDESNELHKKFLYYQLINQNLKYLVTGSGQPQIVRNVLEKHKIMIFQFQEQEKIGNFLSLFDRLIEKVETKVGLLKEFKKGYLQQIFPAKGEKVPKIRFAGFDGDWQYHKLSTHGEGYSGISGLDKNYFNTNKDNAIYITYMDVFSKNVISDPSGTFLNVNENQNIVKYGDVLFTTSSETREEVGISCLYLGNKPTYLNSFCFGWSSNWERNHYFMSYLFNSTPIRRKIIKLGQGSTRFNISKNKLLNLPLNIPTIKEQEKIGDFFKSLDSMIEKQEKELYSIEQLKKGYMQRLFA